MYDAFKNNSVLLNKFEEERVKTIKEFTWENAANKILNLTVNK